MYEMIVSTLTSVFDCQKTLQEFKSSHQKSSFRMKPTRLWRFTFQPHWRCFSIIVPHASKYFQSCLPLLHPVNIIFQGQYECLGKYGVTGHLSFCFLFASTFRVVPASLPFFDVGRQQLVGCPNPKTCSRKSTSLNRTRCSIHDWI